MARKKEQEFVKYPHTPHVAWLANTPIRNDKLMSSEEVSDLLTKQVDVEEKIDGSNLGISFTEDAELKVQHRGGYLYKPWKGEHESLEQWLQPRVNALFDVLQTRYILFGEWCRVVHSVSYDELPDYFIGFDIFDKKHQIFLSPEARDSFLATLTILAPCRLYRGKISLSELKELLNHSSSCYRKDGPPEGVYIRAWEQNRIIGRAKLVNPAFAQGISGHWRKGPLTLNKVASSFFIRSYTR